MTMPSRRWWLVGTLAGMLVAAVGASRLTVEVIRRWPIEAVERPLERLGIALRPIAPWTFRARSPATRYESLTAPVAGKLLVIGGFYNDRIQAAARVDEYDPARNQWRRLGDMPVPFTHAMAAVVDGAIWIAGGFLGDHPGPATDQVWRFDPAADQWSRGPSLPAPRGGGALVGLPDGTLHFFGGWLPDRQTDSPDHWRLRRGDSVWTPMAPLPSPRGHLGGVALDGQIYAIGGCFGHDPVPIDVALVHRYDPGTDSWTEVASLPDARSHLEPSSFGYGGRIYVAGGRSRPSGKWSADEVLMYDPATDTWSFAFRLPRGLLAPVAQPLGDHLFVTNGGEDGSRPRNLQSWWTPLDTPWRPAASMPLALGEVAGGVIDGKLYLVGEGDQATLILDLGTGLWRAANHARQRHAVAHHHAAEVFDGELWLLGGLSPEQPEAVQIYDPRTDAWRLGPALPFATGSSASALIDGRFYLAGGIIGDTTTRLAASLDPRTGKWRLIAPMPRARNHAASGTDGRRLYVFGGRGPGSGDRNTVANGYDDVQVYDPVTDSWTASGDGPDAPRPLPQARGGMGKAAYLNGEFYVIGGETLDGPGASPERVYARVDIYDPVRNTWREGPPMPTPRHGIFPVVHGPGIWVAGGGVRAGASASTVVEVLIPR